MRHVQQHLGHVQPAPGPGGGLGARGALDGLGVRDAAMPGVIMCISRRGARPAPDTSRRRSRIDDERTSRQQHRGARLPGPRGGRRPLRRGPVLRPRRVAPARRGRTGRRRAGAHRAPTRRWARPDGLRAGAAHRPADGAAHHRDRRPVRAHGARQVVVLGAGLDSRAWRMPELAAATVLRSTTRRRSRTSSAGSPTSTDRRRGRAGRRRPRGRTARPRSSRPASTGPVRRPGSGRASCRT